MKKFFMLVAFLGLSSFAYADGNAVSPAVYTNAGNVGLGLVGEDPSGLTLKLNMTERNSLDFRLGLDRFDNDFLLLQGNYLVDVAYLTRGEDLSLYVGGGATFFFLGDNLDIAVRVPIGLDLEFAGDRFDVFLEAAPQMLFLNDIFIGVDGALGIRYFF